MAGKGNWYQSAPSYPSYPSYSSYPSNKPHNIKEANHARQ